MPCDNGRVRTVHHEDLWDGHFIVIEVGIDVEALDFIEAFNLVLGLSADTIAFKNSDVEVTAEAETVEILTGHDYTACASKRIINKITSLDLTHICHQEC